MIGRDAKDRLKLFPSSIYWSGLGSWGIRLFTGSKAEYHRSVDRFYKRAILRDDDSKDITLGSRPENWDPNLPRRPSNLLEECSLKLNRREAEYLRNRILSTHESSLLALLVLEDGIEKRDFWELPTIDKLDDRLKVEIGYARNFSETMHGAALLYNLLLSEGHAGFGFGKEEWIDGFREDLQEWSDRIIARGKGLNSWQADLSRFWEATALAHANVARSTIRFVEDWSRLVASTAHPISLLSDSRARDMIEAREREVKRLRARIGDPSRLENYTGGAGDGQLKYRWGVASKFVSDILEGLKRKGKEFA